VKIFREVIFGIIIVLIFILNVNIGHSADLSFEYIRQCNQSDNFGPADGLKISYVPKQFQAYAWLSGEHARFNMAGQNLGAVDLIGAGIGTFYKIKEFTFSLDGGWYYPYHKDDQRQLKADGKDVGDRAEIYLSRYGDLKWDYYKFHISGNFGATIGIKYHIGIVTVGIGYRMLELPLSVEGKMHHSDLSWSRYEDQNVSGPIFSIGYAW